MPKPKSKTELLAASAEAYGTLQCLVDGLSECQQHAEFPFSHRDRNVRDVVAHLYAWQKMFLGWYKTGMAGGKPEMPAQGYTWKTTPQLNATIWERYQEVSLEDVRDRLERSHLQLIRLIESHSEQELFERQHYSWTGSTSLGAYLISATSSHYQWANKLLRKYRKLSQSS